MAGLMTITCPKCRKEFERDGAGCFPFCSKRCQQLDFGAWMTGQYRVAAGPAALDDEDSGDGAVRRPEDGGGEDEGGGYGYQ